MLSETSLALSRGHTSSYLGLTAASYALKVIKRLLGGLEYTRQPIRDLDNQDCLKLTCLRSLCFRLLSWMRFASSVASS